MFLGSMGMDFLFNPDFGMGQSHFYRNGGIINCDFKPMLTTVRAIKDIEVKTSTLF